MMKTMQEIKDEVADNFGVTDWNELYQEVDGISNVVIDEVAKRYALEAAKETLNNALAVTIHHYFVTHDDKPIERHVLEELINNETNIPELI